MSAWIPSNPWRWLLGLLALAILWLGFVWLKDCWEQRQMAQEVARMQLENDERHERADVERQQVERYKNDHASLEEHARRRLGMVSEGEEIYIPEEADAAPEADQEQEGP